ncbi:MAG: terminase [Rhizobiales bacterium 65-79]|nr:phage terminase large subunit family protein [Hyphomicrobiales bacterium]OJU02605.1 MAG: terminase [Rhizobiales bacterium 65-79]
MPTLLASPKRLRHEILAEVVAPPPPVNYLEWAKTNIVFSARLSEFAGPYNEELFPFFSEVLRAFSPDDPCRIVTLKKSAQVGGTVLANIFTLGSLAMDPGDFLYVHPTEDNASRWSKQKLRPLLLETASLAPLFPEKSRDGGSSILYKERVDGRGAIQISGANSPASLSMISMKRQVQDDLAKWEINPAGDPEGQADSRSEAFEFAKIFKNSTPLIQPGCRITRNYLAGTQERYHVPCPHCAYMQPLDWENMRDRLDEAHPERACFWCVKCGAAIEQHHRASIVRRGVWIAKYPDRAREHRSFHIWAAYGPLQSWERIARRWFNLQRGRPDGAHEDTKEAKAAEQVFFNDTLGLAYEVSGKSVPWEDLRDRAEALGFTRGIVPKAALKLTLGIDVQQDRVEWLLIGWGRRRARFVIDRGVIDGQNAMPGVPCGGHISEDPVRAALDRLVERTWPDEHGNRRPVDLTAIDGNAWTDDVLGWASHHPVSRVIAVRGVGQETAPVFWQVKVEKNRRGRPRKFGLRFFNFNASLLKARLYLYLAKDDPEQTGYVAFARGLGDDFFEQLTAEVRVGRTGKNGFTVYSWEKVKPGARNEALDMMNQAETAANRLGIQYMAEEDWDAIEDELSRPSADPQLDLESALLAPQPAKAGPPPASSKPLDVVELMKQLNG